MLCVFCFSCKENPVGDNVTPIVHVNHLNNPVVENGVLSFSKYADFDAFLVKMGTMNDKNYKAWSQNLIFESLYSEYVKKSDKSQSEPLNEFPDLNSINSNYAKLSDKRGIVFIDGYTYLFTSEEIKVKKGVDEKSISILTSVTNKSDYKGKGITSSEVKTFVKKSSQGRSAPFLYTQRGNYIRSNFFMEATLEFKQYNKLIPNGSYCDTDPFTGQVYCSPDYIVESMNTGTIDAKYYRDQQLGGNVRETPQRFEFSWTFKVNNGTPQTGVFNESSTDRLYVTFYDGPGGNISEFNAPISALDYLPTGTTLEKSETTFVFTN
jgi:hypothetical protein